MHADGRMSVKSTAEDYRVQSTRTQGATNGERGSSGQHVSQGSGQVAVVVDAVDLEVAEESIFVWEKHIDKQSGEVYFFNPKTGVSQWDPPTVRPVKKQGK